jgi:hypothetical protein
VWWREVSSATLGTNTSLTGNILASTSISLQAGARLNGRALAQTGAVTLNNNIITGSNGLAAQTTPTTASATAQMTATSATAQPTTASATTQPTTSSATAQPTTSSATATLLPVVTGLPGTGGGPIRNEDSPWDLMIVGGFGAIIALAFGIRIYRSKNLPKQ